MNNKLKAITFSYDDGVTQDIRLIELLNKYGLKCTFNLNSELLGKKGMLTRVGQRISHYKIHPQDVMGVYEGHEVAVHTLTHPNLTRLTDAEIIYQVEQDRALHLQNHVRADRADRAGDIRYHPHIYAVRRSARKGRRILDPLL